MKKHFFVLIVAALAILSCDKELIERPENLIKEKQMIEMMADMHLAEATFNGRRYKDNTVKKSSSSDFYYSVLKKYEVADSVFEKSFVYYASNPKNFEKMYRKVMNILSEKEEMYSGKNNKTLELSDPKSKR
ncbi:MAG: DUF4296 domain-containing protein [Prolixibacteraceae bacterium]|nr:DUF4296 domain-containing protein [Prolixibacteraceae bacterium]